jgi:hypothetical protein
MVIKQLGVGRGGNGVQLTLTRRIPGAYDPTTGGSTPTINVDYVGSGLRVNYNEYAYRNETIVYGDFQLYVSPVLIDGTDCPDPQIGDIIYFLEKKIKVINVKPFNDNGTDCGWKLQVRYG